MAKITINPSDLTELATPLYRKDENTVYKLLPETLASQVKMMDGSNAETRFSVLQTDLNNAAEIAANGLSNANSAIASAGQANAAAMAAQTTANSAKSMADANGNALTNCATKAEMNSALDEKVSKAGDTMSGDLTISSVLPHLKIKNASDEFLQAPTGILYSRVYFIDKNNLLLGCLQYVSKNDGRRELDMCIFHYTGDSEQIGTRTQNVMRVGFTQDGTPYTLINKPASSSNDYNAATTSWTRERIASATGKAATAFDTASYAQVLNIAISENETAEACIYNSHMVTPPMLEAARRVINEYTSNAIFTGFFFDIKGRTYYFTYDLYDQQNISDAAIMAMQDLNSELFAYNEDGEMEELVLKPAEAKDLHLYGAVSHKGNLIKQSHEWQKLAAKAQTYAALEYELENMGLLLEYDAVLNTMNISE